MQNPIAGRLWGLPAGIDRVPAGARRHLAALLAGTPYKSYKDLYEIACVKDGFSNFFQIFSDFVAIFCRPMPAGTGTGRLPVLPDLPAGMPDSSYPACRLTSRH